MIKDYIVAKDGFKIPVAYFPIDNPKGVLQIVHGSWEHKGRYYKFIEYMNLNGYTCIISDNRGHGEAVTKEYPLGYMKSLEETMSDLYEVTKYAKERNPNVPFSLLGHSLGSLYGRIYLEDHDNELSHLILSGTVNYRFGAGIGPFMADFIKIFKGKYGTSKFLAKASDLNRPSEEWVSYSKENIKNIKEDELMGNQFLIGGYKVLFKATIELKKYRHYKVKNPDLKILSITGDHDSVAGGEKGLDDSIRRLNKIGYKNVTNIVYKDMMHEILQEDEREKVYKDIIKFLEI